MPADEEKSAPKKPDAIQFHDSFKKGQSAIARLQHVQMTLGPLLGGTEYTELGAKYGGRVYSRDIGGGMWLATLSLTSEGLLFPGGTPSPANYRWEVQPDGTRHGFLLTPEELEGTPKKGQA